MDAIQKYAAHGELTLQYHASQEAHAPNLTFVNVNHSATLKVAADRVMLREDQTKGQLITGYVVEAALYGAIVLCDRSLCSRG
jgi:hypothetical protein